MMACEAKSGDDAVDVESGAVDNTQECSSVGSRKTRNTETKRNETNGLDRPSCSELSSITVGSIHWLACETRC